MDISFGSYFIKVNIQVYFFKIQSVAVKADWVLMALFKLVGHLVIGGLLSLIGFVLLYNSIKSYKSRLFLNY